MQLPFTAEQFFQVFRAYNIAVWPAQVVLLAAALLAIAVVVRPRPSSGAIVSGVLTGLWVWVGAVYHLGFFVAINKGAYAFGALSFVGAGFFFWHGIVRRQLQFRLSTRPLALFGVAMLLFAIVVYPGWTSLSGHHYPAYPTFGLPCPTTLFTVGMLALLVSPYPRAPLFIPLLWCIIGAQAAFLLGVQADLGLVAAAFLSLAILWRAGHGTAPGGRA